MLKNMACHEIGIAVGLLGVRAAGFGAEPPAAASAPPPKATNGGAKGRGGIGGGGRGTAQVSRVSVELDKAFSALERHGEHTDWRRLKWTFSLEPPTHAVGASIVSITFVADRCGGDGSDIVLTTLPDADSRTTRSAKRTLGGDARAAEHGGADEAEAGETVLRFQMPSEEELAGINARRAAHPQMRTYFLVQWNHYISFKDRILSYIEQTKGGAAGREAVAWPEGVTTIEQAWEVLFIAEHLDVLFREQLKRVGTGATA
jgi:hypothetical protein